MSIETMTAEEVAEGKLNEAGDVKEILASGEDVGLRVWRDEEPGADKELHTNSYETVGYVLKGKAELHLNDKVIELTEGNSYLVPKEAEHTYKIIETFTAVEATSPPAHLQ
ncbi:cupin domain-containing protein [Gracilimonas sp. BCB1]|uniref:cupin domain-containing protein n=1 Tax=Gracilimonas sp. BCB1 TaxID=3152362 RepID=UPI0032D906FE